MFVFVWCVDIMAYLHIWIAGILFQEFEVDILFLLCTLRLQSRLVFKFIMYMWNIWSYLCEGLDSSGIKYNTYLHLTLSWKSAVYI
jgi:hypothetical protein